MVNFQFNSTSLVGILLMVAGAGLYFLRSVKPELARDHDIFFSAIGLVCGLIFVFQAWRFDPIMQFGQILLAVTAGFFGFDSIRMRGIATEQAKRNTRTVEEDRPVSSVYYTEDAELEDDLEPRDYRYNPRQLRGSAASSRRRPQALDYDDDRPRSSSRNRDNRLGPGSSRRSRRSSSSEARIVDSNRDLWGKETRNDWDNSNSSRDEWGADNSADTSNGDSSTRKRRRPKSERPTSNYESSADTATRPRRTRPRPNPETDATATEADANPPSDYVNYQPVEPKDDNRDDYTEY